jgi:hypothetical protein
MHNQIKCFRKFQAHHHIISLTSSPIILPSATLASKQQLMHNIPSYLRDQCHCPCPLSHISPRSCRVGWEVGRVHSTHIPCSKEKSQTTQLHSVICPSTISTSSSSLSFSSEAQLLLIVWVINVFILCQLIVHCLSLTTMQAPGGWGDRIFNSLI